jgi:hypothetical protein
VPSLPNQINAQAIAGSMWNTSYQLYDDNGDLMNIVGKTFGFRIRPTVTDSTPTPLVSVSSTGASAQGSITVDTVTSTVQVVLTPAATALLGRGTRPYALWMNPGLADATDLVTGTFQSALTAAA